MWVYLCNVQVQPITRQRSISVTLENVNTPLAFNIFKGYKNWTLEWNELTECEL